jgi:hypothetical protein
VVRQLAAAGVTTVTVDARCTVEDSELFSHRRDASTRAATGRFAAVVWLEPSSSS